MKSEVMQMKLTEIFGITSRKGKKRTFKESRRSSRLLEFFRHMIDEATLDLSRFDEPDWEYYKHPQARAFAPASPLNRQQKPDWPPKKSDPASGEGWTQSYTGKYTAIVNGFLGKTKPGTKFTGDSPGSPSWNSGKAQIIGAIKKNGRAASDQEAMDVLHELEAQGMVKYDRQKDEYTVQGDKTDAGDPAGEKPGWTSVPT